MPDWLRLVSQRLSELALDSAEKEEVHAELAAHLEETCESFRREGLSERAAVHRTLSQVDNWHDLQRSISIAKKTEDPMKNRMRQLWIPGFLTLILSTIFLMTLQGFQPRTVSWSSPGTVFLYVPWLMSLPLFGALGAYFSCRAGGSRRTVLLASVFPVLALTAAFLSMFPIGSVIERIIGRKNGFGIVATTILRDGVGWLLVPGAALLAGGLLVHILFSRTSSSPDTAIS
ncbi:MAG TPA: hypothetical protein VFN26_09475 [Candidatus Acidoferrum sp.]|nr:hypothetical protein [Candidatus Acidoferrum sp.]